MIELQYISIDRQPVGPRGELTNLKLSPLILFRSPANGDRSDRQTHLNEMWTPKILEYYHLDVAYESGVLRDFCDPQVIWSNLVNQLYRVLGNLICEIFVLCACVCAQKEYLLVCDLLFCRIYAVQYKWLLLFSFAEGIPAISFSYARYVSIFLRMSDLFHFQLINREIDRKQTNEDQEWLALCARFESAMDKMAKIRGNSCYRAFR